MAWRTNRFPIVGGLMALAFACAAQGADDLVLRTGVEPEVLCVDTTGLVEITLHAENLTQAINSVQARLHYDAAMLALVSTTGVIETPWMSVNVSHSASNGMVVVAAIYPDDGDTNGIAEDTLVATLTFAAMAPGAASVGFLPDDPPYTTRLTRAADNSVVTPGLTDSGIIRAYDADAGCCAPSDGTVNPLDDGLTCTLDVCSTGTGEVSHTLMGGACLIENVCYADAELNPANDCEMCASAVNTAGWTYVDEGMACGDPSNTVCDNPDTCDGEGLCQPNFEPSSTKCRLAVGLCDVSENCDGAGACPEDLFEPDGTACNDGLFCTLAEACSNGVCTDGIPRACDDGDACTANACDEVADACVFTDTTSVTVNLDVQAISSNATREVVFVLSADCGGVIEEHVVPISLDSNGAGFVLLDDSLAGDFRLSDYIHAAEGHTLGRRLDLAFDSPDGCNATADFTGANVLVAGDFQTTHVAQDNLVDITDFSILATRWDSIVDECPGGDPGDCHLGADATGDGIQDIADFTAIQVNFFAAGDDELACATPVSNALPVDRPVALQPRRAAIAVRRLQAQVPNADRADLNHDTIIDARDIRLFAQRHGIALRPEFDARLRRIEETRLSDEAKDATDITRGNKARR